MIAILLLFLYFYIDIFTSAPLLHNAPGIPGSDVGRFVITKLPDI
jgi:hypothetical protein